MTPMSEHVEPNATQSMAENLRLKKREKEFNDVSGSEGFEAGLLVAVRGFEM